MDEDGLGVLCILIMIGSLFMTIVIAIEEPIVLLWIVAVILLIIIDPVINWLKG